MRNDEEEHKAKNEGMNKRTNMKKKCEVEQVNYFCCMKEIDELVHDI